MAASRRPAADPAGAVRVWGRATGCGGLTIRPAEKTAPRQTVCVHPIRARSARNVAAIEAYRKIGFIDTGVRHEEGFGPQLIFAKPLG